MKKLTIAALATMVATFLAADTAEAQRQHQGRQGARGAHEQGMHRGGGMQGPFAPGLLLRRSAALDLSEEQIATLTDLRDGLEAAGREVREGHAGGQNTMRELMSADEPNLAAIREEFARNHAVMSQFQWARIEAGVNAKTILTDVQRGRVEGFAQASHRRGGQARSRSGRGSRQHQNGQRMGGRRNNQNR